MKNYFFFLLIVMLVVSCVEPVSFDAETPQKILIVDGSINPGQSKHTVKLSISGPLDKRVFDPVGNAEITLVNDNGGSAAYTEVLEGEYELDAGELAVEVGQSYHLEIELADGKRYRSESEKVPEKVLIDSLSFESGSEQFINDFGNVTSNNYVRFFVDFTLPIVGEGPFLRWNLQDIYLVTEKICSPLDNALSCYIYPPDVVPAINLLSGSSFTPGAPFKEELVQRDIDYAFGERYSLSVFQLAHTEAALAYWSKVDQVVTLEGSIFDVAPAPIQGNVFNEEDENEQVLGYFSAVNSDTAHIFVTRFDVAQTENVSPFCGPPEQPVFLSPTECCNCLNLANSTLDRPGFW